ncbi:MAG: CDP-alcohol phosphatidyltransferase family protein [Acidimicrobiales bacterium]
MLDGHWRDAVDRTTKPVGTALVRIGVTADVLTVLGLVMSGVCAWAIASGHLLIAIGMLFPTGLPDLFDGPVAKASGTASVRGAFFDSVADRVSDALLFGGLSWYLVERHHGTMALLPFAIMAVTQLISYQRAKAELLGLSAKGGLMERAERFILLGVCFLAGAASASALVPSLWVFFGLIAATAAGRFVRVWKEAEGPVRSAPSRRRDARVDSRWRTWREARAHRAATFRTSWATRSRPAGEPLGRWWARREGDEPVRPARTWGSRRPRRSARAGGHGSASSGH